MTLTPTRLAELRAIERAATAGPWRSEVQEPSDQERLIVALKEKWVAELPCGGIMHAKQDAYNLRFIVEVRNAMPQLLNELEAARAKIGKLEKEKRAWSMVAAMQNMGISAVANDRHYKCQCGTEYTDGEQCPPCFAAHAKDIYHQIWQASKGNGDFPANTDWQAIITGGRNGS